MKLLGAIDLRRELEARLCGGDFRGVLEQAAEWLALPGSDEGEGAWVAVLACRAAGARREWGKAVSWAERGLALEPDAEALGWLNLLLGTALMYIGDPLRSERCLRAFVTAASEGPALRRLLPEGQFNLGHLLRFLGRPPAAEIDCFCQAGAGFREQGRIGQVLLCHAEAAWSHLMAGQARPALPELEAATADLSRHGDPTLQIYVQICWAEFWRLQGEPARAEAICRELADRPDLTPGQSADVAWLLAGLAQSSGDWPAAAELAERAYAEALEDWWPLQVNRIEALRSTLQAKQAGR